MAEPKNHYIVGIHITNRVKHVPSVQNVLTEYGCEIKTRLGLHDTSDSSCSPNGLLIIEFLGENGKLENFTKALTSIEGVDVKSMVFSHE
jgi:hypothetical protein